MIRTLKLVLPLLIAVATASAQAPSVPAGGILNSASYALDGLPGAGVAQGSLFVIYGTRMGPDTGQMVSAAFPLPKTLAQTEVTITSGGSTVKALLIYVSAGLIKAILPSSTPVGAATLTVTYNGQASTPTPFNVVKSGFGMYTINQAGSGPAVATNPGYTVNTLTSAMEPLSPITIWGTGLGPATGDESTGPVTLDSTVASQVEVWVGNQKAQVTYAGRGGGFAGLDQVNFVIPQGVQGCYVPLYVKIGNAISNYGSLSIAAPGKSVCSDSFSYGEADLEKARTAGGLKIGSIVLSRMALSMNVPGFGNMVLKNDSGSSSFKRFDLPGLLRSQGSYGISALGSCVVHSFKGADYLAIDPIVPVMLDAGPSLQLTGPGGAKTIDLKFKGVYSSSYTALGIPNPADPGYLVPGRYTVKGTGGADVGAFTAALDIPALLTWTNQDAITDVTRSQGQQIVWTGGGANDAVMMMGVSALTTPEVGAMFVCAEAASKGSFTIPAAVLNSLPVSPVGTDGTPSGMLMVGTMPVFSQNTFTASGIDVGYFVYSTLHNKMVNFK